MGDSKFFFEEDSEAQNGTGVSYEEQADIFGAALEESGVGNKLGSMAPLQAEVTPMKLEVESNKLIQIEYGIVGKDYVVHITPTHPNRNLQSDQKLNAAIKAAILTMNQVVPFDLQVQIHLPQEDWDVKVLSFVLKDGADFWSFDQNKFKAVSIPELMQQLSAICTKI